MVTRRNRIARLVALATLALLTASCVKVPQNRRAHLADPMMSVTDDPVDAHRKRMLYTTREGAAGGDGVSAGGGCGCQ